MTQRHEDSDDDTYVTLGSAFEKLETVEDVEKAKRKKDKEHYVTDDRGRRRFHGAFTGGFSAGYFNTVGSEEGWTPSTFVSSKSKKSEFSGQRPEDFMDAEDLGDHGIAPRAITAKEPFTQQSSGVGTKRELETQHAVIPGTPALQNLIVPARSSVGAKLLKSMGWKEGQGVGPKTARYASRQGAKKVYGCSLPGQEDSSNYPKEAEGFLFAPVDVTPWEAQGKDDMHGIGYRGIQDQHILGSRKATKALYGMSGEAFGVGALEDGDEDEDNVYGTETLTSYDSTLAAEGDISMERKFGWTGALQTGEWGLSSFKKAAKHTTNTKKYPPPDVPRDFTCKHNFFSSEDTRPPSASVAAPPTSAHLPEGVASSRRKPLGSAERSQLLSDSPDSVFNLLSRSDREKLKAATEHAKTGKDINSSPQQGLLPHQQGLPPHRQGVPPHQQGVPPHQQGVPPHQSITTSVFKPAAGEAAKVKPFAREPEKAARYEAFLAGKPLSAVESRMTEWERQREEEEFSRLTKVFQPLNASRFTRGEEEGSNVMGKEETAKRPERPLTPESDAVQAAKANMFGILTRETVDWHPHRLICKRFNIPDPYPNSSVVGVASERKGRGRYPQDASRNINFIHTERIVSIPEAKPESSGASSDHVTHQSDHVTSRNVSTPTSGTTPTAGTGGADVARPLPDVPPEEAQTTTTAAASEVTVRVSEAKRPPMDLFKAIFADSSSESDSSGDTDKEDADENVPGPTLTHPTGGRKWQDLSVITNTVIPTNGNSSVQPEHSQTHKPPSDKVLMSAKTGISASRDEKKSHEQDHTHHSGDHRHGSWNHDHAHRHGNRDHTQDHTHRRSSRDIDHTKDRHDSGNRDHTQRHRSSERDDNKRTRVSGNEVRGQSGRLDDRGQYHGNRDGDNQTSKQMRMSEGGEEERVTAAGSYGPALPPDLGLEAANYTTRNEEEVEGGEMRSKKPKHKDHHREHHHKKKHKVHKDHKKHRHSKNSD